MDLNELIDSKLNRDHILDLKPLMKERKCFLSAVWPLVIQKVTENCKELEVLLALNCKLNSQDLNQLAKALQNNSNLRELNIHDNGLSKSVLEEFISQLTDESCPQPKGLKELLYKRGNETPKEDAVARLNLLLSTNKIVPSR